MAIYVSEVERLVPEWDNEKNDMEPSDVSIGSHKRVWWRCQVCHHSWEARIANRVNGAGCPYCSGRMVNTVEESIVTKCPETMKFWNWDRNTEKPEYILPKSHKKLWWRCEKGHEWCAAVYSVTGGSGCPYCSNIYAVSEAEKLPDYLKQEWLKTNREDPSLVSRYSAKRVWWKCSVCQKEWQASILGRTEGLGCPRCQRKRYNSAIDYIRNTPLLHARLADDSTGTKQTYDETSYHHRFLWKCEQGHDWRATVDYLEKGYGCPYCNEFWPKAGVTDLATLRPDLAAEWDNDEITPSWFTTKSTERIRWKCSKCGNKWVVSIYSRVKNNSGCPYCSGRKAMPGVSDIKTLYPEVVEDWDMLRNLPLRIEHMKPSSKVRVNWTCHICGNRTKDSVNNWIRRGCPICHSIQKE